MTDERDYKYDLFISYNRADEEWAKKLATRIEQEKWRDRNLRVFFAPWDIRPGESVDERLDRALEESRYVGLILSPESVDSQWVGEEWYSTHHAGMKRKERRIIPLYRRACEIPRFIDHLNRIDFRDDDKFDEGVCLLLAVLREEPLPRGTRQEAPRDALPPSSIPRPPSFGFVSRRDTQGRDIVARLREELAAVCNQLVTLSGPGGIGKTTLAAEAARELQESYKGRIVWSSADGRADFTLLVLLDEIATQLGQPGLRTLASGAKEEQVRALVADAPTLVVLDNYETVAGEEQKRVEAWFRTARCSALFTSRPKVGGTVFVPVSAMSREEADDFLERLAGQTQDPQMFTPEVRRQIYETAEANPHVMQWVVGQIDEARVPDKVFKELAEGEGDAAERVFARSFNLPQLGDDGRDALLALSLFAPSASREALAQVAGFGDDWEKRLDEAVKNLHALWLVKGLDGYHRLTVEGLTRSMAAARLSRDPRADEFRRRFVAYFLRYAEEREAPTPENYDALEEDKDNLLGAAEAAFTSEEWDSVTRMAYVVAIPATNATGMLIVRGYWGEAVRLGEQALQAAWSLNDKKSIAGLSLNLSAMYMNLGELTKAQRLCSEGLKAIKKLGDQYVIASLTSQLAIIHRYLGEPEESKARHEESLAIRRNIGDQPGIAIDLHGLATLAHIEHRVEEARRLYNESLEISKGLGNQRSVAVTLNQLGNLAHDEGNTGEARHLYNESLEIKKGLGDQGGVAATLHNLATLAYGEGDKEAAARLFREALSIFERLGSPNAEIARRGLARVEGEGS
jgi:tetratricopeptide (TPR) repeat protein